MMQKLDSSAIEMVQVRMQIAFDLKRLYDISSGKKYEFLCDCGHKFISKLDNIIKNKWCPYCSSPPKNLCENEKCEKCFEKSFASHPKSKFWSNKNIIIPRKIFKYTNQKVIFNCNECTNEFEAVSKM
jgi:hypothetical protein